MVKFYVYRIKAGKITIDDVPEKWRAAVESLLAAKQDLRETNNLSYRRNMSIGRQRDERKTE